MRKNSFRYSFAAAGAALAWTMSPLCVTPVYAQDTRVITRAPQVISGLFGNPNRAVLGVTLTAASRADTLGVRIGEVNPDGPAAKAGLASGMIITSIDGVSLQVSAADAADPRLSGIAHRRLTRTLEKASAGDELELRVLDNGRSRTLRVKTVAASELVEEPFRGVMASVAASGNRASIGMSIGATGSVRDTLGIFVSAVTPGGPAETAGIIEGDRIVSINGVDLRTPREDVEDLPSRMARVSRFNREMQKLTAGDRVTLRVSSNGREREVTVATVKASELRGTGFQLQMGDGTFYFNAPGVRILGDSLLRMVPSSDRLDEVRAFRGATPRSSNVYSLPLRSHWYPR